MVLPFLYPFFCGMPRA